MRLDSQIKLFGSAWRLLESGNHNHKGPKDNNKNLEQKKILPIDQETSNVHTAPVG
jgi:hypothetical protein